MVPTKDSPLADGDKVYFLTVNGMGEITRQEMTVKLHTNDQEFLGNGCRHSKFYLHPMGAPFGGVAPLTHFPTSCHYYCREQDLKEATKRLLAYWLETHNDAVLEANQLVLEIKASISKVSDLQAKL